MGNSYRVFGACVSNPREQVFKMQLAMVRHRIQLNQNKPIPVRVCTETAPARTWPLNSGIARTTGNPSHGNHLSVRPGARITTGISHTPLGSPSPYAIEKHIQNDGRETSLTKGQRPFTVMRRAPKRGGQTPRLPLHSLAMPPAVNYASTPCVFPINC